MKPPLQLRREHFFSRGCQMTGCLNGGSFLFNKENEIFSCSFKLPWSAEQCKKVNSCFAFSLSQYYF